MVGKNIKKYREGKKLTQDEIAEKLSVTRQAVSNWENGKTEPDIETLHKLAEAFEVSIEELIYGERRKNFYIIHKHVSKEEAAQDAVNLSSVVGAALAVVISYAKWQSIKWTILHGFLGWIYVIYYIIKYGWS